MMMMDGDDDGPFPWLAQCSEQLLVRSHRCRRVEIVADEVPMLPTAACSKLAAACTLLHIPRKV